MVQHERRLFYVGLASNSVLLVWRQIRFYWYGANHYVHVEVISFRHFLDASHFIQKIAPLHHSRDDCELVDKMAV